MSVMTVSNVKR